MAFQGSHLLFSSLLCVCVSACVCVCVIELQSRTETMTLDIKEHLLYLHVKLHCCVTLGISTSAGFILYFYYHYFIVVLTESHLNLFKNPDRPRPRLYIKGKIYILGSNKIEKMTSNISKFNSIFFLQGIV